MAKKQTIILTHGSNAPVYSKDDYKKGEVLVCHAGVAKDAALYTANENETDWIEFPSKEWVDDKFTGDGGINKQITALGERLEVIEGNGEGSLAKVLTDAKGYADGLNTAMDTRVKANTDAIDAIKADYLKAADKTELEGKISAVEADVDAIKADYLKAADKTELSNAIDGVSGRVETIEKDYLKAADKTELSNAITNLKNNEVTANTNAIGEIKADYLKAADKTELLGKIAEAQNAATTKVESGDDFINVTQSTDKTTQSTTYKVAITNKVATAESLKTAIDRLDVIEGEASVEGSMKNIAATEVAKVVASAPEDFDTLKEIADWIGSDTTGAAEMANDITELKGTVAGFSTADTVKKTTDALDVRVKAIEDDYLKAGDKTELEGKVTAEANVRETADKAINDKIGGDFSATNTVATVIAKEVQDRKDAVQGIQDKIDALGNTYATDTELSNAVSALEGKITAAKKAATTKVAEGTDDGNNLSISNTTAEDGSVTYTVNLTNVAKANDLTAVSDLVNPIKDAVVTASVANTETNKITASVASHHLTLNFDGMVIDGGEY